MSDVPIPADTGSDGTQLAVSAGQVPAVMAQALRALPVEVLDRYAMNDHREFGKSPMLPQLVAAYMAEKERDLALARSDAAAHSSALETTRNELAGAKESNSVLKERLGTIGRLDILFQLSNVCAAAVLGLSVDLFKSNISPAGEILAVVGAVLLLVPSLGLFLRRAKK